METWLTVSLVLCTFGFFKELRPSEPFITGYIVDFKNVTADEVVHVAFPISTYSSLASLVVAFLVTDLLRYRIVVVFEALMYVLTWTVLVLGSGLAHIIIVEILFGIASSTEIAYYTYIYAQVDKVHYSKVTSHTSCALYVGKFVGGLLAQLIVTFHLSDYHGMTCLTLLFSLVGFTATLFLPKVVHSLYFHPSPGQDSSLPKYDRDNSNKLSRPCYFFSNVDLKPGLAKLYQAFLSAYSHSVTLRWSLWWALASAGQYQVVNYIQPLWETINAEKELQPFNGLVKATHTLLSAIFCLVVGYVKLDWNRWGESLLGSVSLIQGGLLIWMVTSNDLYIAYTCYTIFRSAHSVILAIASAEVAKLIDKDSHALIFGFNILLALLLQTILTLVVVDERGLALEVTTQFLVYGGYFILLGAIFCTVFISSKVVALEVDENPSHSCNERE